MCYTGGYISISDDYNHPLLVPWLRTIVEPLLETTKYNGVKVKITDLDSSAPLYILLTQGYDKCDRFTMHIPYGNDTLKWPISFIWSHPEIFPIVGFDDDEFRPEFEEVKGLIEWDSSNPNALIRLVDDFLDQYRKFQILICNQCERLKMELEYLNESRRDLSKMDVLIEETDAIFVFSMQVAGVLDLPNVYVTDEIVDDQVTLKVRYRNFRSGADAATVELIVCPFLNGVFGAKFGPKLPPFECFLSEYVDRVQEILDTSVREIKDLYQMRNNFITRCRAIFKHILDGDFVFWTRITFLMQTNNFFYVLHVKLPNGWPSVPADLQAASVYHERRQDETPFTEKFTWKPTVLGKTEDQLAEELKKIAEEIGPKFLKSCRDFGV